MQASKPHIPGPLSLNRRSRDDESSKAYTPVTPRLQIAFKSIYVKI